MKARSVANLDRLKSPIGKTEQEVAAWGKQATSAAISRAEDLRIEVSRQPLQIGPEHAILFDRRQKCADFF
jgi:hypothetical protein